MLQMSFWRGKRVFLTGHTGFKGSWLCLLLHRLGAKVTGYALAPESERSLFVSGRVGAKVESILGDVRDAGALAGTVRKADPEIVLHLAAQSLVRRSHADPVLTYATNVIGTVNLFEAVRRSAGVRAMVVVTSDKCYENREWDRPYRESDALGGRDPYSNSKACTELVTTAYRSSFFQAGPPIATVRAGNVIGGGDWSDDRLVPDLVRGILSGAPTAIRNPKATRPWQHVLEPAVGYLATAERLAAHGSDVPPALNFGPDAGGEKTVAVLADGFCSLWGDGASWRYVEDSNIAEAQELRLDSSLARRTLGWRPRWAFDRTLEATVEWYRAMVHGQETGAVSEQQIDAYLANAMD